MERFIRKELYSSTGSGEHTEMFIEVDTQTGKSKVIIKKTIIERYPVQKIEEAMALYENITGGGGRPVITLQDFVG